MMSVRMITCMAVGCLTLCAVLPARAQFVYRLGGPVMPMRDLAWMHLKNRFQFKKVVAYPYGVPPYGGAAMYSGFNHGHYPALDGVDESPITPEVLNPPRQAK
jgi:hypothetical protein